jgi:hypothetical protein
MLQNGYPGAATIVDDLTKPLDGSARMLAERQVSTVIHEQRVDDIEDRRLRQRFGHEPERPLGDWLTGQGGADRRMADPRLPGKVGCSPTAASHLLSQTARVDDDAHRVTSEGAPVPPPEGGPTLTTGVMVVRLLAARSARRDQC